MHRVPFCDQPYNLVMFVLALDSSRKTNNWSFAKRLAIPNNSRFRFTSSCSCSLGLSVFFWSISQPSKRATHRRFNNRRVHMFNEFFERDAGLLADQVVDLLFVLQRDFARRFRPTFFRFEWTYRGLFFEIPHSSFTDAEGLCSLAALSTRS